MGTWFSRQVLGLWSNLWRAIKARGVLWAFLNKLIRCWVHVRLWGCWISPQIKRILLHPILVNFFSNTISFRVIQKVARVCNICFKVSGKILLWGKVMGRASALLLFRRAWIHPLRPSGGVDCVRYLYVRTYNCACLSSCKIMEYISHKYL